MATDQTRLDPDPETDLEARRLAAQADNEDRYPQEDE